VTQQDRRSPILRPLDLERLSAFYGFPRLPNYHLQADGTSFEPTPISDTLSLPLLFPPTLAYRLPPSTPGRPNELGSCLRGLAGLAELAGLSGPTRSSGQQADCFGLKA
jgi:hypothetical protein